MEDIFVDVNSQTIACICVVAFLMVAVVASNSRGGVVAALAASILTLFGTIAGRSAITRAGVIAVVLGVVVASIVTSLEIDTRLLDRLSAVEEAVLTGREGRLTIWSWTLTALSEYWLTGSGLGTYRFATLPYYEELSGVWFHHAESIPLEVFVETGIVGLGISIAVATYVVRHILRQGALRKEVLLFPAALYATAAILLHSLVDFSLILPGVFLPYAALVGTYVGRSRRCEIEHARAKELGEAAHDARLRVSASKPQKTGKWIPHTVVFVACTLAVIIGAYSLRGFAEAERLNQLVSATRDEWTSAEASKSASPPSQSSADTLVAKVAEARAVYATHAEVAHQIGVAELLLWQRELVASPDWGETSLRDRWRFSNPQRVASLLRRTDAESDALREAVSGQEAGMVHCRAAFDGFMRSLTGCPLDCRSVWGLLSSDSHFLNAKTHSIVLASARRLSKNNSTFLGRAGIAAIEEGRTAEGIAVLKDISDAQFFLSAAFLAAVQRLSPSELLDVLPESRIFRAKFVRQLSTKEGYAELTAALVADVYDHLVDLRGEQPEDWLALAWIARQREDRTRELDLLKLGRLLHPAHWDIRMALVDLLLALDRREEAREELKAFAQLAPSTSERDAANARLESLFSAAPAFQ